MASYKEMVEWIAHHDSPVDDDVPPDLCGYPTVMLVASVTGRDVETVAHAVYRARHPGYKKPRKDSKQPPLTPAQYRARARGVSARMVNATILEEAAKRPSTQMEVPAPKPGERLPDYRERAAQVSPFRPDSVGHKRWMDAVYRECSRVYGSRTSLHKQATRPSRPYKGKLNEMFKF